MQFEIARQPLVPAFLTLLALAVAYASTVGWESAGALAAGSAPAVLADSATGGSASGLAFTQPDRLLALFQVSRPGWSKALAALFILFTGLTAGRLAVRYNLYAVATCLGIPLFGMIACGVGKGDYLCGFVAAALLGLAVKHFSRSFCNGYAFDALFRASLYLALTILVIPSALPLLLLLPLAVVMFRRTLREAVVAVAGFAAAPLALCYVNWGMGGNFAAPLAYILDTFLAGAPLGLFTALPPTRWMLPGAFLLLDLAAVYCLLTDLYAVGTKARFILLFDVCALLLSAALLCGPAATPALIALAALPSALLLPFLFVRIHRTASTAVYLLLLAAAATSIFLQ